MPRLVYLDTALDDLDEIFRHIVIESGRLEAGLLFTDRLRAQCAKLAELPGVLGHARPELHPGLRSFPFKGYVILFRYEAGAFEVVGVIEGHRDIDSLFSEEGP